MRQECNSVNLLQCHLPPEVNKPRVKVLPSDTIFARAQSHRGLIESMMRKIIEEHCTEPLKAILHEHLDSGGRRVRGLLVLAAVEVFGGEASSAIGWAAACELLHNATLVHDDLQDGDEARRGRPALWFKHGKAHAINAGDLLLISPVLAVSTLAMEDARKWELIHAFARYSAKIASGQALELEMTADSVVDPVLYRKTVALKTGGLFELPLFGAALLAGLKTKKAAGIGNAFQPLGVLYQMQDDVLDLYGNKGRNEVGADIREGKISALVVHHLQLYPEDRQWLLDLLRRPRNATPESGVRAVVERFRSGGALAHVIHDMDREAENARKAAIATDIEGLPGLVDELISLVVAPVRGIAESCREKPFDAEGAGTR